MTMFLESPSTSANARSPTRIASSPPSDFCDDLAIYLTPQREVAEYYARLRERMSGLGNGDVGILTIYIRQFEHKTLDGDKWNQVSDSHR